MARSIANFRIHTYEQLARVCVDDFAALVEEWVQLNQSPTSARAVALWRLLEPVFADCRELWHIPQMIDQADWDGKDEALAALIRLAQAGHSLAARTVLQCMLPALRNLQSSYRGTYLRSSELSGHRPGLDKAETEHFIVTECWELIMKYPLDRRPRKIAANLAKDTRKNSIAPPHNSPRIPVPLSEIEEPADEFDLEAEIVDDHQIALFSNDLTACLQWALDQGALTHKECDLLADVYLDNHASNPFRPTTRMVPVENETKKQIYQRRAAAEGVSYFAISQQVGRAKNRLVAAIKADLLTPRIETAELPERSFCIS